MNRRISAFSVVLAAALVALMATIATEFIVSWPGSVAVLDVPDDQLAGLSDTDINDKLLSGEFQLKHYQGLGKALVKLQYEPLRLAGTWLSFFVASALTCYLAAWIQRRRHPATAPDQE